MNQLGHLAYNIWDNEFGTHSNELEREREAILISGYLEANIGSLNILINSDFILDKDEDEVTPNLKYEEKVIFSKLYLKDNLKKQARAVLRDAAGTFNNGSDSNMNWTELREGDSSIKRSVASPATKNASARILKDEAAQLAEEIKDMVHAYNMYGALPLQVAGKDALVFDSYDFKNKDCPKTMPAEYFGTNMSSLGGKNNVNAIHHKLDIGIDEVYIPWSNFTPSKVPIVVGNLRSTDSSDPIIPFQIKGQPTKKGVTFVFASTLPSDNYIMDVFASVE